MTGVSMKRLEQFLVGRFWNRRYARGGIATWPGEAVVRRRLNQRLTGSPHVWPIDWLAREWIPRPFPRALSLGCGDGTLERDLMSKGLCEAMLGLDLSEQALELARRRAAAAGLAGLEYRRADLDRLSLEPESREAVFAHQALHHVRELEACLSQVARALVVGGMLYADEYTGPSRHEWRRELLAVAEEVYRELPAAVRHRRRLRLPVDWRDPSEAVRSSEIVPLIEAAFDVRERRGYGGNLLSVIYPHLRLDGLGTAARDEILEHLLDREDELLAAGVESFYTVIVALRRPAEATG